MSTEIKSDKVLIKASSQEVFDFVTDFNNIVQLLPEDKISDWQSTEDDCSFKIQNAAIIPLVKSTIEPHSKINIVSGEKAPFPFTLEVYLSDHEDGTESYLVFNGEINPFLKMMVVKPLTNLFNYMAHRLETIHAKD